MYAHMYASIIDLEGRNGGGRDDDSEAPTESRKDSRSISEILKFTLRSWNLYGNVENAVKRKDGKTIRDL